VKPGFRRFIFGKLSTRQSGTAPLPAQGRTVSPSPASCRRCLLPRDAASPRRPPPQLATLGAPARGPRPQRAALGTPPRHDARPLGCRLGALDPNARRRSVPQALHGGSARRTGATQRAAARCRRRAAPPPRGAGGRTSSSSPGASRRSPHSSLTVYSSPFLLVLVCID